MLDGAARAIGQGRHRQLHAQFRELVREQRLEEALHVGQALLTRLPGNSSVRRSLANCHARLGDDDTAAAILLDGMAPSLLAELEGPIRRANRQIGGAASGDAPWRLLPKGISNVCVIDHRLQDGDGLEYVTKVIRGTRRHKEVRFFESITEWSPGIAALAPRLLLSQELPRLGMVMVTIEKVIGRQPDVHDLPSVIRSHEIVTRAAIPDAMPSGSKRRAVSDVLRREVSWKTRRKTLLPETLAHVHVAGVNERLMGHLMRRAAREEWPDSLHELVRRMSRSCLGAGISRWVVPARDYGFLHGDFQKANLLVDERDGRVRVLDWESYRYGPPAVDLVRYLGAHHTFGAIESAAPAPGGGSDAGSAVPYLLFVYGLLTSWLDVMPVLEMEAKFDEYLAPALERLESLIAEMASGDLAV